MSRQDMMNKLGLTEDDFLPTDKKQHKKPTQLDMVEAQAMYTALLTDTLIESEVEL